MPQFAKSFEPLTTKHLAEHLCQKENRVLRCRDVEMSMSVLCFDHFSPRFGIVFCVWRLSLVLGS